MSLGSTMHRVSTHAPRRDCLRCLTIYSQNAFEPGESLARSTCLRIRQSKLTCLIRFIREVPITRIECKHRINVSALPSRHNCPSSAPSPLLVPTA